MPFISSSETKNLYFFCFTRGSKRHIHDKNLNFIFIIYNFKRGRFFALNNIIRVRTLLHINDDVA